MFQVSDERIAAIGTCGAHTVPTAVDLACPECRRDVTFSLGQWNGSTVQGLPNPARCPRCGQTTAFIRLGGPSREELRLFVDAEPTERTPLAGLSSVPEDKFSPRLMKAYNSALRALANGDPEATAVHCRRVLEGVTGTLLDTEERLPRPLGRRLELLAKHHGDLLAQPLLDLSKSLKDGGNLGAHFDDEDDTSLEDAKHMVELLDNLIAYVYVLPQRIQQFRAEVLGEKDAG